VRDCSAVTTTTSTTTTTNTTTTTTTTTTSDNTVNNEKVYSFLLHLIYMMYVRAYDLHISVTLSYQKQPGLHMQPTVLTTFLKAHTDNCQCSAYFCNQRNIFPGEIKKKVFEIAKLICVFACMENNWTSLPIQKNGFVFSYQWRIHQRLFLSLMQ
jgi:hypothetical protein